MSDPGIRNIEDLRRAKLDLENAAYELDNALKWSMAHRGQEYWFKVYTQLEDLVAELEDMIEEYDEAERERDE